MIRLHSFLTGLVAALATAFVLLASPAAMAVDYGWNPVLGTEAFHGVFVSQGNPPALVLNTLASGVGPNVVVSGTAGCGTLVNPKGGGTAGQVTAGTFAASCAITLTFPVAAPNGWLCRFNDLTTSADLILQATSTTTTCVSNAATIVTGDTVQFLAIGY